MWMGYGVICVNMNIYHVHPRFHNSGNNCFLHEHANRFVLPQGLQTLQGRLLDCKPVAGVVTRSKNSVRTSGKAEILSGFHSRCALAELLHPDPAHYAARASRCAFAIPLASFRRWTPTVYVTLQWPQYHSPVALLHLLFWLPTSLGWLMRLPL